MVPYLEAINRVLEYVSRPKNSIQIPLSKAYGRVVAEDILADMDIPPFDKAMMDGFAVRSREVVSSPSRLDVVTEIPAGEMSSVTISEGQAASVMTGAPVPKGADSVVMVEHTSGFGKKEVIIKRPSRVHDNISQRGEIARQGDVVVKRGTRIGVEEAALLAMVGADPVLVYQQPRVAVVATGDELVAPSVTPGPAQIRNCSTVSLRAFFFEYGIEIEDLGTVPDNIDATREVVKRALEYDLVVLTGGVSVGVYDFVKEVLEENGVTVHLSRVAVKPGKPTVFGTKDGKMIFGLPGNPVSTTVITRVIVEPALRKRLGLGDVVRKPIPARLESDIKKKVGRLYFVPAQITFGDKIVVRPIPNRGSADIPSAAAANCLVIAPAEATLVPKGSLVQVVVWGRSL